MADRIRLRDEDAAALIAEGDPPRPMPHPDSTDEYRPPSHEEADRG